MVKGWSLFYMPDRDILKTGAISKGI